MYGHLLGHSQQRETVSRTGLIPFRNWLCCSKNLVFFQLILLSGDWEPSWNHKNPTCQSSCSSFGESLPPSVVLAPLLSEIVLSSLLRAPPVSQSGPDPVSPGSGAGTQCHSGCVHTLLPYFGTTTSSVIRYSEFRTKSSLCTMSAKVLVSRFPLWWRRQSKNNSSRNSAAEHWRHCAVGGDAHSIYWGRRIPEGGG